MVLRAAASIVALLAAFTGPASAAFVEHVVEFADTDLTVTRAAGYDVVRISGCDVTREVGRPELPALALTVALPAGTVPTALEVLGLEPLLLRGPYTPAPSHPPSILPVPGLALPEWRPAAPDPAVYGGTEPYPQAAATLTSGGRMAACSAAGIVVHPVQFLPGSGALLFHPRIVLRVSYETAPAPAGLRTNAAVLKAASSVFANSPVGAPDPSAGRTGTRLSPGDFEYVIVTTAGLQASFDPLAAWKTRKGVPAKTVTVEWINTAYPGADTQARVRTFIADACAAWGTAWVLLGGDTMLLPARRAYAMTCEAGGHPDEDAIACDLYFSDLDGSWNADGDAVYGETTDGVDLYPDVFVGRASVQSMADAQAFVAKVIEYERSPEPGWLLDMLLAGEILWEDPYTDSGIALNLIDREYIPPRFDPITKLYESLGNESVASVVNAVNAGKSHFLHSGHAWYDCMGCGTGYLLRTDVDDLSNAHEQPLLYSIGCWPAAFDLAQDCMAERFIRNPHGGAVAFIGNSRYGWAAPGNPGYGYSERFMQAFYRALLVDGACHAGAALAIAKAGFIPLAQAENVYRWHEYEVNLLGDPETPVWTDDPADLVVRHPVAAVVGPSVFNVSVTRDGAPVAGALACVMKGYEVYERGRTGDDGTVALAVNAPGPGTLWVTVTAPDCRPYEASVPVSATGPWVVVESCSIDDEEGNRDGLAGPGETVDLSVVLRNAGTEAVQGVSASLSSDDPLVQVTVGTAAFGSLPPGATSSGTPFTLAVAGDSPDRHTAVMTLVATSGGRDSWTEAVPVTVAAPVLAAGAPAADDSQGDGDGVLDPGETVQLLIGVSNEGLAAAAWPSIILSSLDPLVTVTAASAAVGPIAPGATADAVFEVAIDPSCAVPSFPELRVTTETVDGFAFDDTLAIVVGAAGTGSDFESGAAGWTSAGTGDMWHLSDYRAHSGSMSWYCGSAATHAYGNNMDCHLDSPPFMLAPDTELSFWCWHSVPIYGEDGLFLEVVSDGGVTDTLDFIGSGGALGTLGTIGNDWLEYRYDVEGVVGDTVQVRFRFSSNASETAEGFYLDDVLVRSGAAPPQTGVPDGAPAAPLARLSQNRPNPFSASTSLSFTLTRATPVTVAVYTTGGRLVRTLLSGPLAEGEHRVDWDGRDAEGAPVAAGVYLCRLAAGSETVLRKAVVVR